MYFYFPIEIQARELPSRISIALSLIDRGHKVLICDQKILERNLKNLPAGIILHKDTSDCNAGKFFTEGKKYHHFTSALDEEGLVYFSEEAYKKSRLGKETLKNTDLIFCWGSAQQEIIDSLDLKDTKIVISGHPKFEIQRNIPRVNGEYILINTRFGSVNNGLVAGVSEYIKRMRLVDEVKDKDDENFRRQYYVFMENLMEKFLELISHLAETFPKENFLIRPHPVESRDIYEDLTKSYDNLRLSKKENLLEEDIKKSKAVIHNGCSTGIEALAMGKPVFIYEPIDTPKGDMALPNRYGVIEKSLENICYQIFNLENVDYNWSEALKGIDNFVSNFSYGSSSTIIARNLEELITKDMNDNKNESIFFRTNPSLINLIISKLPKFMNFGFISSRRKAINYSNDKNPDLPLKNFELIVSDLQRTLKSNSKVKVTKVETKSFIIENLK
tara:strand:+ start:2565 stop:3902 length:1338 start_codon:yes stop_codon:yes gene_type:complete